VIDIILDSPSPESELIVQNGKMTVLAEPSSSSSEKKKPVLSTKGYTFE
jgi:hypothetical protein